MKKIILKSLLWLGVAWVGSMAIFIFWGQDLANLKENIGIWVFGAFMGIMATYLGKILPGTSEK